jgi:hypothetical protein
MTAAPPPLPGGRVLAGWRRDLAPLQAARLWVASFLVHRVEAAVRVARPRSLDPLQTALLRRAASATTVPPNGNDPLLARLLRGLADDGLLAAEGGRWRLTDRGRAALAGGGAEDAEERREFTFLDEGAGGPPRYLRLEGPGGAPAAPPDWRFDPAELAACVGRPPEWKARRGFPAEVAAVLPADPAAADWRRVVVDRAEQWTILFLLARGDEPPALLGFEARPDGWALRREPAVRLGEGWAEALPELAAEPPPEAWRAAWRAWAQPRGLPPAEVDACRLERLGDRVRVAAPTRLVQRLREARSDALKGEAWLLAGEGRVRSAAEVELVESEPA